MPPKFPKKTLGALLLAEGAPGLTRRRITIAAGAGLLAMGTVLALSADDRTLHVQIDPASTEAGDKIGTCTVSTGPDVVRDVFGPPRDSIAVAVLGEDVDASDAGGDDIEALGLVMHCALAEEEVIWPAGITNDQKAAAIAQLEQRGIVLRETI